MLQYPVSYSIPNKPASRTLGIRQVYLFSSICYLFAYSNIRQTHRLPSLPAHRVSHTALLHCTVSWSGAYTTQSIFLTYSLNMPTNSFSFFVKLFDHTTDLLTLLLAYWPYYQLPDLTTNLLTLLLVYWPYYWPSDPTDICLHLLTIVDLMILRAVSQSCDVYYKNLAIFVKINLCPAPNNLFNSLGYRRPENVIFGPKPESYI